MESQDYFPRCYFSSRVRARINSFVDLLYERYNIPSFIPQDELNSMELDLFELVQMTLPVCLSHIVYFIDSSKREYDSETIEFYNRIGVHVISVASVTGVKLFNRTLPFSQKTTNPTP